MFNSVQYVRDLCRARRLPISQLERDCGFANGYLNPKKLQRLPYDRALTIAQYLEVSVELILTGEEKAPADTGKRSVSEEDIKFALFRGREDITDEMYQEVLRFAEFVAQREQDRKD